MPRRPRITLGNHIYHVINRANNKTQIFKNEMDYGLFESILISAKEKYNMRILAFVLMPNHFHLVLHPRGDGDISKFMHWCTTVFTQRWHSNHKTSGTGHIFQGRFKSFVVMNDDYLLHLIQYRKKSIKGKSCSESGELALVEFVDTRTKASAFRATQLQYIKITRRVANQHAF